MAKVNWQRIGVAVFSILSMLSVAPYSLGDIATIIPPEWKPKVLAVSAIAAFILHVWYGVNPKPPPPNPSQ